MINCSNNPQLLNQVVDISNDFSKIENEYFLAARLLNFDVKHGEGNLQWQRHSYGLDWAFDKIGLKLERRGGKELPQEDYAIDPVCKFRLSFISTRTMRLRLATSLLFNSSHPSLILKGKPRENFPWQMQKVKSGIRYQHEAGKVYLSFDPWYIEFRNSADQVLTHTFRHQKTGPSPRKAYPFLFMRRSVDYSRSVAANFALSHDEKIYGCGESFTRLNKRGQKIVLWTTDAQSATSQQMYKPVPFFISSKGYGIFVHTSTPVTFDFGQQYDGAATLFVGDEELDLFFFFGSPQEIVSEYTALTGRSSLPPVWSFGLWMSRFSYKSQKEVYRVAQNLQRHKIPCDVIHIDAGWFKHGWRCDYEFSPRTFPDPAKLIADLGRQGLHVSLWQLPYYTPKNPLYREIVQKKLYVRNDKGEVATEDVILDFSNPAAITWYRNKISKLFDLGVGVIKADFGEAAPLAGYYTSGKSGFYEHNLYPLRYTEILSRICREKTGESLIWARSTWAGGQRYPVHWSGDPESSDLDMAATLRAGLSLGLCGFSFWSHDMGGFSSSPDKELYRRWLIFGMLTSHSRTHGFPPREPWFFGKQFISEFRRITDLKYCLLPYIYSQAALCCQLGFPMLRTLFFQYPQDPTSWFIEDQYLFGHDILVAPLLTANHSERLVYLPPGEWIDFQTGGSYAGEKWYKLRPTGIPCVIMVRNSAIIPQIKGAQSTAFLDWTNLDLVVFDTAGDKAICPLFVPGERKIKNISLTKRNNIWKMDKNPFGRKVNFRIIEYRQYLQDGSRNIHVAPR